MIAVVALILELVGVGFLVVATIGVIRFRDPFQRMHAATKAGTVGAGLVLAGTAFSQDSVDGVVIALVTILFLVATMPVAGHLLGRAFYISGAPLLSQQDALKGVLPRMKRPLEERHRDIRTARNASAAMLKADARAQDRSRRAGRARSDAAGDDAADNAGRSVEAGYDAVRFAVIAPDAGRVARRAQALAAARNVPLTGVAVIDESLIGAAESPETDVREVIRARLAKAVAETRAATAGSAVPLSLSYEEGDPLALIPGRDPALREILLLPTDGWCHHGAPVTLPADEERMADKLFALAARHQGPTLFVGTAAGTKPRCIVFHDGSRKAQHLAAWVLRTRLWPGASVTVVGPATPEQIKALIAMGKEAGARVVPMRRSKAPAGALLPPRHAGVTAVILAGLPQPAHIHFDGTFWQDRLIPGFRGDVLVG
jgi:monovalent cation/proton antiporter MnhG/PhaG subunit